MKFEQKMRLLFCAIGAGLIVSCQNPKPESLEKKSPEFKTALVETGELQAVNSKIVSVPHFKWEFSSNGRAKLIWLEKEGIQIKKGHIIARLDTSNIKRVMEQKQADLNIAFADLKKLKVEQASKLNGLNTKFLTAKADLKRAQIGTQRVKYESRAAQEISRCRLEIAEIELQKVKNKIKHTQNIHKEELLIQNEKVKQIEAAIENAQHTIDRFALHAPSDGLVEYRRHRRTREKVRIGDEFWQVRPLIGLPDLSQMKVQTSVNETDINKIHLGQKVVVRLDAYPKAAFAGKITAISITCHEKEEKSKIKIFDVEVLLEKADPILKPGMTVSCEILAGST